MEQQSEPENNLVGNMEMQREYESSPAYLREVLKCVVEIGASLRLQMDTDTLFKRIVNATCQALCFRYAVLYLDDGAGFFRVAATGGVSGGERDYLEQHPLPDGVVARIIDEQYRMSDSYFLPSDAPIWQDQVFANYFVVVNPVNGSFLPAAPFPPASLPGRNWHPEDLLIVPLVSGDNQLLGFLNPDAPLNGLRPTIETMTILELFANQATVAIEGSRLYSGLREAVRQARESEHVKNNFLMTASHELRTPLTAVQGYLELLGDYGETLDDASRARFIQNARRGCDELVLLLGNVLDATHLDIEKISFKLSSVHLAQSANLILEILEPIIAREERQVEDQIPEEISVWIDELRLRQILLNLLGNALKYTPPGTRIALSAERMDMPQLRQRFPTLAFFLAVEPDFFVILAVRDWGAGIPPAEQDQLFTRFARLESARNSSQPGAGLGLYLCRQLVEAMGGLIWMESSGLPGEGATFFVALPGDRA